MPAEPVALLPDVIALARTAGEMVAREFARPGGPRFSDHVTAPLDHEIELLLRDHLMALLPARFVGEEAGIVEAPANGFCWVVDPHDGTRAFLEGKRGSAVSIALLRAGVPVLGVVYAPLSPDRGQDMIAWAEGGGISRNGASVTVDLRAKTLEPGDVVFLNHGVWQRPVWNSIACAPGRFMPLPSIAYRLARVAVGDGIATQTLRPVNALDIAAGHALLLAAGGVLVAEDGVPVTYNELGESRPSACFGGAPPAIDILRTRAWRGSTEDRREARVTLDWPRIAEGSDFERAAGALLGLAIGGADPDGQLSADTEPALLLARALIGHDALPAPLWHNEASALRCAVPIGIWGGAPDRAAAHARDYCGSDQAGWIAAAVAGGGLAGSHDPAITQALRGVAKGRAAFAPRQALAVLTCRPDPALGVKRPRPEPYWPDDLIDIAEALLRRPEK